MESSKTYLITDPIYEKHLTGPGHPESPMRYVSILDALNSLGVEEIRPRDATENDILLCHTPEYLNTVISDVQKCAEFGITDGSCCLSTGDAQICPESYKIALRAAGALLTGTDKVMEGEAQNVFCLVRPPGHHACSDTGMGFCLFNNVAIGARYAQKKYGVKRVLIVDWDVHHGNGTQEIFYSDPSVFYFSTHQSPLYPGTGAEDEIGSGEAVGTILNCPIALGPESRLKVFEAFREQLIPEMAKFKPELVMISAGFDAHTGDPLGSFNLSDDDFSELTAIVKQIANEYAQDRIISALEGGYNLHAIASAAKAHVRTLMKNPK